MESVNTVARQLAALTSRLESARRESPEQAARFVEDAESVFEELEVAEGKHVTLALELGAFDFERAQRELESIFRRFGTLARRIAEVLGEALSPEQAKRLNELAFMGERAPLTSAKDLASIRGAAAERAKLPCRT